jgi:hypothetical protein
VAGTVFTVPFGAGYQPGSLRVFLDDQAQPGVIEQDPVAGTFTLTFDVLPSEVLTLEWIAGAAAPSCPATLAAGIAATASGGTLNVTGCTFTDEEVECDQPITIIGGTMVGGSYTTGQAITVTGDDVSILGMTITNYRRAISITGADDALVQGCHLYSLGRTGIESQQASLRSRILNNLIHATGLLAEGNAEGIYIGSARSSPGWTEPDLTADGEIAYNTVYDCPGDGIDVKDDVQGFDIHHNTVYDCTEPDTGAINVRGFDNTIRSNYCHDNDASGFRFGGTPSGVALNTVTDNVSDDNTGYGYKCTDGPQTVFTGNTGTGNGDGFSTGCT